MSERWKIGSIEAEGGLPTIRMGMADDAFITAASFEERSLALTHYLSPSYSAKRGIIYFNQEFLDDEVADASATQKNLLAIENHLGPLVDQLDRLKGSWLQPIAQWRSIRLAVEQLSAARAITIDATTFTRESLIVMLGLLRHQCVGATIRLLYVSPVDHGDWLSTGAREVRNVIGYGGLHDPRKQTLLMVLSGFETERTIELIDAHEPALVLLGLGYPPTSQQFFERNLSDMQVVLGRQEVRCFDFPADDVIACAEAVEFEVTEYRASHNIVVAPMSTKLSTVGVLLAAEHCPDVQITYSVPVEYNIREYSSGCSELFSTMLPASSNVIQVE